MQSEIQIKKLLENTFVRAQETLERLMEIEDFLNWKLEKEKKKEGG